MQHSGTRCCGQWILAIVLILTLGSALALASDESSAPPRSSLFVQETLSRAGAACANALEGSASTDCLVDQALNTIVMEEVSGFVSEQGGILFGDNFRLVTRLSWSPTGGTGLVGDIDAVFPLAFGTASDPVSMAPDGTGTESDALFLQWGVSHWTDDVGVRRDNLRYGLVRRFALSNTPGAGVLGASGLLQQGLESGHQRFVVGLDYAGSWGTGWFNQYTATTGWRPGRSGFQERALEGAELGLRLTPTTTIGLETALTRWEDKDDLGKWRTGARVGLDWRPHPWLSFRTAWEDTGQSDGSASFGVRLSIPLGGGHRERPRWEGLGLAGAGSGSEANAPDIWRPLDNVRPIQVAEQAIPSPASPSQLPSPQAADDEECRAGQTVRPGESCVYPGTDLEFSVLASGSGRLGFFTSGRSLTIVNTTINGQRITFVANRLDDGSWLIERVGDSVSGNVPDLAVGSPTVSDASPDAGASFTLRATVSNAGDGRSAATTLRYYRSSDATISASDTAVGTDAVGALAASGTSAESVSLTAPSSAGTYYYGVCVDAVAGESDTANNCSAAVTVTVGSGDASAETAPHFYDTVPAQTYTVGTAARALRLPTAYGGDGALTYALTPAVPGLSFDAATRRLSGTPTQAGTYPMTYRAADADANTGDSDAAIRTFTITVQAAGDFAPRMFGTVASQTYTVGTAARALRLPTAYGGDGALTYALTPAVPGLSFDAATRRLSGTPTQAGTYPMTYRAADADANTGDSDAAIRTFTITVQAAGDFAPRMFGTVASQTYTSGTIIAALTLPRAYGGNGVVSYTLTPEVPGLSFDAATRRLSGTPTQAGTWRMTYRAGDADANSADVDTAVKTFTITVEAPAGAGTADLAVGSPTVSDASPDAGASFTLRATVSNAGDGRSAATTLRYYRSSDATISASDTAVGTDAVGALAASGTSAESVSLTAPSSAGTYYYGVCVDAVAGESDTANNCSAAVTVTVGSGDASAETAPHFYDTVPAQTYTVGTAARALRLPTAYGGDGALTYALTPAVPGLSFDAATRRLSGTPTQAGTYPMTYRAADADANTGDSDAAIRTFTITVQAAGDFAPRMFGTVASQTYTVGTAARALRLPTAYGGDGALTYALTPAVPGLSFDAATRRLSGTPTQAGTYPMTYRAADADANTGDSDAAIRTFTITVQAAGDFAPRMFGTVASQTYTVGTAARALRLPTAYGGDGALTYALTPAVPGLSFDAATRRLSGTPTQAGTYPMTYRAADADANTGDSDAAIRTFTITVQAAGDFAPRMFGTVASQTYTVGTAARALRLPTAYGGDGALTYALTPAVPGLSFDAATRRLSGTPTQAGTYPMTYRAADADANTGDSDAAIRTFTITVQAAGDFAPRMFGTVASQTYTVGTAARALRLPTAYGGDGALTYALTPAVPGLSFDAATRRLSGTPTQAGTYPMTYRAADADANTGDSDAAIRTFTITVQAAGDFAPRMFGTVASQTYTSGTIIAALTLPRAYGGNGVVSYTLTPEVPGLSFDAATRRLSGTPTQAGTWRMTYRAGDADANSADVDTAVKTFTITVEAPAGAGTADLAVGSPTVSDASPDAGASFTLRATVSNAGDGRSAATTLRYYRSSDATISASDTAVGTDAVGALAASGTSAESVSLTAPSSAGTYYYGVCVDAVAGESDTANNCSTGVRVTTTTGKATSSPDLYVILLEGDSLNPSAGELFTVDVRVANQGDETSSPTTVNFWYHFNNSNRSRPSWAGSENISSVFPRLESRSEVLHNTVKASIRRRARVPGTYYFFACIEPVLGESVTSNNCSAVTQRVVVEDIGPAFTVTIADCSLTGAVQQGKNVVLVRGTVRINRRLERVPTFWLRVNGQLKGAVWPPWPVNEVRNVGDSIDFSYFVTISDGTLDECMPTELHWTEGWWSDPETI